MKVQKHKQDNTTGISVKDVRGITLYKGRRGIVYLSRRTNCTAVADNLFQLLYFLLGYEYYDLTHFLFYFV